MTLGVQGYRGSCAGPQETFLAPEAASRQSDRATSRISGRDRSLLPAGLGPMQRATQPDFTASLSRGEGTREGKGRPGCSSSADEPRTLVAKDWGLHWLFIKDPRQGFEGPEQPVPQGNVLTLAMAWRLALRPWFVLLVTE